MPLKHPWFSTMKCILIVGISGTGKSRFAKLLSEKLNLPVVNLDSIFWKENWVEEDETTVEQMIAKEIAKERWIIEGYIEPLSRQRVEAVDTVIYLDYLGYQAARGGLARMLKHSKTPRPEMPKGNVDKLSYKFLKSLYRRDERSEIERAIKGYDNVIRLKNRPATKRYLALLDQAK